MAGHVARRMFRTPLRTALLALALALTLGGFALAAPGVLPVPKPAPSAIPVKGTVTVVDLGAKTCIPCKMMAPILVELEKKYEGKAAIIFIDVWEKPEESKRFQVSAIPTQIFFDRNGKEVYRHLGFLDKQSIIDRINKMMDVK